MLIVTRRRRRKICIGDNVVVTVLRITGDQVKIGIDAPREVEISRPEAKGGVKSVHAADENLLLVARDVPRVL